MGLAGLRGWRLVVAAIFIGWLLIALVGQIAESSRNRNSGTATTRAPTPDAELTSVEGGAVSLDRNFYIVLDGSGSMGSKDCAGQFATRVEAAKWAVKEFTTKSVPADVNLGLYVFDNSGARERVPIGKGNRGAITTQIDRTQDGGETPLNGAIRTAVRELVKQRNRQLGYGDFYAVVATDGEATDGDLATGAVGYADQNSIPIITIGFCLNQSHPLSRGSISYRNANSPQDLLTALQETQGESPYFDVSTFRSTQ